MSHWDILQYSHIAQLETVMPQKPSLSAEHRTVEIQMLLGLLMNLSVFDPELLTG